MSTTMAAGLVSGAGRTSGGKMETKRIKLLRGVVVNGETHNVGDVLECDPGDARYLIGCKSAEETKDKLLEGGPVPLEVAGKK